MANNAKKQARVGGRFVANPNSERSKAKARKAAKEAAAKQAPNRAGHTVKDPVDRATTAKDRESTGATANPAPNGDRESTEDDDGALPDDDVTEANKAPSHIEEMFPNPPKQNGDVKTPEIVDDDDDSDDDSPDKPRKSRAQRKRAKMLAEQMVKASDGLFGTYVKFRHPWIQQIMSMPNAPPELAGMKDLAALTETEKDVLIESLARYIEENGIELSPAAELAMMFGGMFGMRIITLEGIRFAANKAGG